jgi:hypothetical protein
LTAGIAIERFVAKAEEALSFKHLSKIACDEKLKLAIEVAMSHRFEASDNAQFITLITSLEALLPDLPVSPEASAAITEARQIIRNKRNTFARADPEWSELERLLDRINTLRVDSVVSAGVILTHPVDVKLTHLGEDDGFFGAVDVDPGGSSGDTSDGPKGRRNQGDCQAAGLLAQHSAALFA